MQNEEYNSFFKSFCYDSSSIKQARLNRALFRELLVDRYSKVVGDKIMLFLENQFSSYLHRIDFKGFCNIILEFINYGPEIYNMLLFTCMSTTTTGRVCEHDLFGIKMNFK